MSNQKPKSDLPEGSWAITKEDKLEIQKFGRELHKFVLGYCKSNAIHGKFFPWKIITGGFDYYQQLQSQKVKMAGDDILITQDSIEKYSLGDLLEEPFTPSPEVEASEDSPSPVPVEVPAPSVAPATDVPAVTPAPESAPEAPAGQVANDPVQG